MISYCHLRPEGGNKYICLLTNKTLIVGIKGKDTIFPLADVNRVAIKRKVLLFHSIVGGILMPFCLLGVFSGMGDLWIMMSLAFGGLMLLYYGLAGTVTFCVNTNLKEYDFFIHMAHPGLIHFSKFVNEVVLSEHGYENYFCLVLSNEEWSMAIDSKIVVIPKEGRVLVEGPDKLALGEEEKGFILDKPLENGMNIQYVKEGEGVIVPRIFTDIPISLLREV